jgi:hypothetical protein
MIHEEKYMIHWHVEFITFICTFARELKNLNIIPEKETLSKKAETTKP